MADIKKYTEENDVHKEEKHNAFGGLIPKKTLFYQTTRFHNHCNFKKKKPSSIICDRQSNTK